MIDRGPDNRQPERDVHRLSEGEQLHRNQPLVVIAGDDDVEFAARGAQEHRVAVKRARDVDAALSASRDRWADDGFFLPPEETVLAGVRVEPGYGEPRARDPESRQLARREI